jgi:PTS system fructose-specific IIC component
MELNKMFNANTILLDLAASDQDELFSLVAQKLLDLKLIKNTTTFIAEVKKREATESTAMGDGIAIPHILNPVVNEARIVFVRTQQAIDWKSPDEKPVDLIFFIITSGQDSGEHLSALGDLAGVLMQQENIAQLKAAKKPAEVINVFKAKKVEQKATSANTTYDVVGITACPTGIAHTYLAQEKIIQYAKELGLTAKVETQGRRGTEDKLSQAEIDNAKVIFLAHDKSLTGMGRFNNKKGDWYRN